MDGRQGAEGVGEWCGSVQVPGIRQAVEGLVPYTERHLARIQRLVRSTFLLDYTLAAMVVLPPGEGLEEEGKGKERKEEGGKKRRKREKGVALGMEEQEKRGRGSGGEAEAMGEEEGGRTTEGEAHQNGEVEGVVRGSTEKKTKKQRKVRRIEDGDGEGGNEGERGEDVKASEKEMETKVLSEGMPTTNGHKVRKKKKKQKST